MVLKRPALIMRRSGEGEGFGNREDDARSAVAAGPVSGEVGVFLGDEEKGGRTLPKLELFAEFGFDPAGLTLTKPDAEEELDAADDEQGLGRFADEGEQVVGGEVADAVGECVVALEAIEHVEVRDFQAGGKLGGIGVLLGQPGMQEQGGTVPSLDETGGEIA